MNTRMLMASSALLLVLSAPASAQVVDSTLVGTLTQSLGNTSTATGSGPLVSNVGGQQSLQNQANTLGSIPTALTVGGQTSTGTATGVTLLGSAPIINQVIGGLTSADSSTSFQQSLTNSLTATSASNWLSNTQASGSQSASNGLNNATALLQSGANLSLTQALNQGSTTVPNSQLSSNNMTATSASGAASVAGVGYTNGSTAFGVQSANNGLNTATLGLTSDGVTSSVALQQKLTNGTGFSSSVMNNASAVSVNGGTPTVDPSVSSLLQQSGVQANSLVTSGSSTLALSGVQNATTAVASTLAVGNNATAAVGGGGAASIASVSQNAGAALNNVQSAGALALGDSSIGSAFTQTLGDTATGTSAALTLGTSLNSGLGTTVNNQSATTNAGAAGISGASQAYTLALNNVSSSSGVSGALAQQANALPSTLAKSMTNDLNVSAGGSGAASLNAASQVQNVSVNSLSANGVSGSVTQAGSTNGGVLGGANAVVVGAAGGLASASGLQQVASSSFNSMSVGVGGVGSDAVLSQYAGGSQTIGTAGPLSNQTITGSGVNQSSSNSIIVTGASAQINGAVQSSSNSVNTITK